MFQYYSTETALFVVDPSPFDPKLVFFICRCCSFPFSPSLLFWFIWCTCINTFSLFISCNWFYSCILFFICKFFTWTFSVGSPSSNASHFGLPISLYHHCCFSSNSASSLSFFWTNLFCCL